MKQYSTQGAAPGTRIVLEGTVAHCISSSAEGDTRGEAVWESNGCVRAYLRETLDPQLQHTIGIQVKNPREANGEVPQVSLEAEGSVRVRSMLLQPAGTGAEEGQQRLVVEGQQRLVVTTPRFYVATIRQSSFYPGTTNELTVTFSTTVPLQGDKQAHVRLILSGLTGSLTPDTEALTIMTDAASECANLLAATGKWRRSGGILEVPLLAPSTPGVEYSFSFSLCNPAEAQASAPAYIAVGGGAAVEGRVLEIDSSPAASAAPSAVGGADTGAAGEQARIQETHGELDRGWYNTFSGHLRNQYPDLYDSVSASAQGHTTAIASQNQSRGVVVGVSSDFILRCARSSSSNGACPPTR